MPVVKKEPKEEEKVEGKLKSNLLSKYYVTLV